MGGVGDRLHLFTGELRVQPAALLRQHAPGGGNLDDVGSGAARLADLGGAFDRSGAAVAAAQQLVEILGKTGDIAMPADNRQRGAGGDDARAGDQTFGGAAAQRESAVLRGTRLSHGGESRLCGQERIFRADDHTPFGRFGGCLPEIAAGVAGQMHVQVDQAGHDRLGAEIDDGGIGVGHRFGSAPDFGNLAVADDDGRRPAGRRGCIGQQVADANDLVLGAGACRHHRQRQSRYCQAERAYHQKSPVI